MRRVVMSERERERERCRAICTHACCLFLIRRYRLSVAHRRLQINMGLALSSWDF